MSREDLSMRARTVVAAAMLLMMNLAPASATLRISDDRGGRIGSYLAKFQALKKSGERVEIDGLCASACTMLFGIIPANRICVTPQAILQFHTAWDPTPAGGQIVNAAGNAILWEHYPENIRRWISRHGGLREQILDLQGPELSAMYPPCNK
jgi:hypothetical protein